MNIVKSNSLQKIYVWGVISKMGDGDEFYDSQCAIEWVTFILYVKRAIDARVLWPKDIIISEKNNKIKCLG